MKITKKTVLFFIGYTIVYGVLFFLVGETFNWLSDGEDLPWQKNLSQGIFFGILMAVYQSWVNHKRQKNANKKN